MQTHPIWIYNFLNANFSINGALVAFPKKRGNSNKRSGGEGREHSVGFPSHSPHQASESFGVLGLGTLLVYFFLARMSLQKWPCAAHEAEVRLTNSSIKVVPKFSHNSPKNALRLFQSCSIVVSKMSKICLKDVSMSHWCVKVVHVVHVAPKWGQVVPNYVTKWPWNVLSEWLSPYCCG